MLNFVFLNSIYTFNKILVLRKLGIFLMSVAFLWMVACSGSDTYRGKWKAQTLTGEQMEIIFDAKKMTLVDSTKKKITFDYRQYSINIRNAVETYGITLEDGRSYQINFPIASNEDIGLIVDGNGQLLYTIGRTDYINYEDIYKIN